MLYACVVDRHVQRGGLPSDTSQKTRACDLSYALTSHSNRIILHSTLSSFRLKIICNNDNMLMDFYFKNNFKTQLSGAYHCLVFYIVFLGKDCKGQTTCPLIKFFVVVNEISF